MSKSGGQMQEERKSFKEMVAEAKVGFQNAIKDKKRWITCGIELVLVVLLILADLITKKYIYGACLTRGKIDIIHGVLSLVPVRNTGASFGMLSGKTTYLTVVSTICAVFLFFFIFYTYKRRNLWLRSALILITAGAIGNIVDRIAFGYVRDFIYFELIDFAVFNFADSCLTVGTIVLLIYILFFYGKEEQEKAKARSKQTPAVPPAENNSIVVPEAVADKKDEDAPQDNDEKADTVTEKSDGEI